ncbi:uncharacterized protein G2W53_015002 [Senna tora]|uniref:Uncharacterized protein n=1 Tax=Senna tora TaxID=362788 RepID=A0A834WUS7_9FABA|nr:uncharacterized protein G2W53_015002 [Senna tora]
MATGQISRRHRLVAADLAVENAEVLRESEGEEASAAAEEEVFGLEICGLKHAHEGCQCPSVACPLDFSPIIMVSWFASSSS